MDDPRIKRGWGGGSARHRLPVGSGSYRGSSSRVTRAGGYKSDGGLNKIIKKTASAASTKPTPPKGLTFRHASVGGVPINPKLGGRDIGGRKPPWRKTRILG